MCRYVNLNSQKCRFPGKREYQNLWKIEFTDEGKRAKDDNIPAS